jgi:hypothetical protein
MVAITDGTFAENKPRSSTILNHALGHIKAKSIPTRIPTHVKMNTLDNIATIYFIPIIHLSHTLSRMAIPMLTDILMPKQTPKA